jgi:hypothetical protein
VTRGFFLVPHEKRYILISANQFIGWSSASSPDGRRQALRDAERRYGLYDQGERESAQKDTSGAWKHLNDSVSEYLKAKKMVDGSAS